MYTTAIEIWIPSALSFSVCGSLSCKRQKLLKKVEKTTLQKIPPPTALSGMELLCQKREKGFWIVWMFCHPKQWLSFKSKDEVSFFDLFLLSSMTVAVYPFILFLLWSWFGRHIFYWCNLKRKDFFYAGWQECGQCQQLPLWWSFECWEGTEDGIEQTTTEKPLLPFSFWTFISWHKHNAMYCSSFQEL